MRVLWKRSSSGARGGLGPRCLLVFVLLLLLVVPSTALAGPKSPKPGKGNQTTKHPSVLEAHDRSSWAHRFGSPVFCGGFQLVCTGEVLWGIVPHNEANFPQAVLTNTNGYPLAGRTVRFEGPDGRTCDGVTSSRGFVWCGWAHWEADLGESQTYTAFFDGDDTFLATSDSAVLSTIPVVCSRSGYAEETCTPRTLP